MPAFTKEYTEIEFLSDLDTILKESPTASQRDIGDNLGVSVAVVNALIKRCLDRGWVAVTRLDGRKFKYMLTSEGFSASTKRSISFMKRNFEELRNYKRNIDSYIINAKNSGKTKVILYGSSRIDFLIEECCQNHNMSFIKKENAAVPALGNVAKDEFAIIGDSVQEDAYEVAQGDARMATVFALAR